MKFVRFLKRCWQIFYVNLLWLVFSIPIITCGAATCAAYYVDLKLVDDEECKIGKTFVKGFKDNFKQGVILGLISLVFIGLGVYFWTLIVQNGDASTIAKIGAAAYSLPVVVINIYLFPLVARYENTTKNLLKNALVISIQYLYSTIMLCCFIGAEIVAFSFSFYTRCAAPAILPGIIFFTISSIVKKTFRAIEQI